MNEMSAIKKRRMEITNEVVALLSKHDLTVAEATAILELAKIVIDNYAMVTPVEKEKTAAGGGGYEWIQIRKWCSGQRN